MIKEVTGYFLIPALYRRKETEDMAKGLTRCNVCGKTVEQVFENQMLIIFMSVSVMVANMMEVCLT